MEATIVAWDPGRPFVFASIALTALTRDVSVSAAAPASVAALPRLLQFLLPSCLVADSVCRLGKLLSLA